MPPVSPKFTATLPIGLMLLACSTPGIKSAGSEDAAGNTGGAGGSAAADAAARDMNFGFNVPDGGFVAVDAPPAGCVNLQCRQQTCPGTGTTSVSGTVFAPNGTLPLYNVAVYVPNAPLAPLVQGMTCDRCGTLTSGKPIASALSDQEGKFKVTNVPVGKSVPLVFQVGKWRRQIVIPEVRACQDNPLTDHQLTRLPRNRTEGDLPRVALTSGRCDQLTCMIPKLGLDAAEMGVSGQDRAFTFFSGADGDTSGGPPGMVPATTLWSSYDELKKYDMLLLSCPCTEALGSRGPGAFDALTRYVNAGGRTFGSHFEYVWLRFTPDMGLAGAFSINRGGELGVPPITIDTTFPKGKALADWMKFLDPSLVYGQVPSKAILDDFSAARAPAQTWARSPSAGTIGATTRQPRFMTINTPVGSPPDQQCGRMAHLDVHVTAESAPVRPPGAPAVPFPQSCGSVELTKSEHVLAFFIFDLAACIQEDTKPPVPPVIE
jgi:hypothetical protein